MQEKMKFNYLNIDLMVLKVAGEIRRLPASNETPGLV
jgi:hypothetical protein